MKNSRYSDSQIIAILNQAEAGTPVPDLCREHGMSSASFYKRSSARPFMAWESGGPSMEAWMRRWWHAWRSWRPRIIGWRKCTLRFRYKKMFWRKPWQKSGKAISTSRDGERFCLQGVLEYSPRLYSVFDQWDVLSLSAKAEWWKWAHCRVAYEVDHLP